jgi:general secretion pathway protein G
MKKSGGRDGGFTLVEILIVIVILGILAGVTVLAVTGITDKGKQSACATDSHALVSAEEAYNAEHMTYGTMTELVSGGRIHEPSTLFTIAVAGPATGYTLTGIGDCAGYPAASQSGSA